MSPLPLLLGLLGCASPWTAERALQPSYAALDRDGDGRIVQAEYDVRQLGGTTFAEADLDHDGGIGFDELAALFVGADPAPASAKPQGKAANGGHARHPTKVPRRKGKAKTELGPDAPNPMRQRQEAEWEGRLVLESLAAEVRFADPAAVLPAADAINTAVGSGGLYTAESRAVLATLEQASDTAGVTFPASLRAQALAAVPVTPTLPPLPTRGPLGGPILQGPNAPRGPQGATTTRAR
ncbi:MAG: hypothetical protein Q8P41_04045 [Pseudomonadota bacterium]|nr:hypothetical protein [Pseudomonadota bacterium]